MSIEEQRKAKLRSRRDNHWNMDIINLCREINSIHNKRNLLLEIGVNEDDDKITKVNEELRSAFQLMKQRINTMAEL
jgi:hypothetical protein